MQNLALIKLGGSVVTFKDKPLSANTGAIDKISEALRSIGTPAIVVHGGGSFGHYWSVQYDMHTKPSRYDVRGVAAVHESMIALNQIIVNSMMRSGRNPYGLPPSVFTSGRRPILSKIKQVYAMAKSKILPVTFGDVIYVDRARYSILSGDSLMTIIAKALRPSRVVFATNVDGVYSDLETGEIIPQLSSRAGSNPFKFSISAAADVTGGMQRKITEAFKIATSGMDVMLVNGLYPERIIAAAEGKPTTGTLIKRGRG